jgi:large subunit ribosomal protein L23
MSFNQKASIDLIKCLLITEKTINLIEQNQYSFAVDKQANKTSIKAAIEKLFDVKVISVNTSLQAIKKCKIGKFSGKKTRYKRAIVTLAPENSITLYEDEDA